MLKRNSLPIFSRIVPENIGAELKRQLAENRQFLNKMLEAPPAEITWDNFILRLEEQDDQLMQMWSPIAHLYAVAETASFRTAYNACLPLLTEYHTELRQNEKLFQAIQAIKQGPLYATLDFAQRKIIDNELRDFKLSGIALSAEKKAQYGELQKRLTKLTAQFAEHLLDATQGWYLHVEDPQAVAGVPPSLQILAEQNAREKKLAGWVFTLDYSSFSTVMKYMAHRELRRSMYEAYTTRASDQGPNAGVWDNSAVMQEILTVRYQIAKLVGFNNYTDYSLATKMAGTAEEVLSFLNDLVAHSKSQAEQEINELKQFAKLDGIHDLAAWDLAYYSEKMRQEKFAISQEELRSYFPAPKVLSGLFTLVQRLFGITIVERRDVDVWDPHVQFFEIYDEQQQLRGSFYTDLYARPNKREGAWMDDCRVRRRTADHLLQVPIAFLTCNFNRPIDSKPALLTHEEVLTVFHEFGHCLHHLLTKIDYGAVSGINGVPWDAVEFPSQLLEHWGWEKEVLHLISAHEETGEPLPDSLFNKLVGIKNFQAGMHMLRQLEFALFDFRLHQEFLPEKGGAQIQALLDEIRQQVSVISVPRFNRFQHSFSHVFAGAYAAGYYSYKWAEVLSCDAFSLFEEKGIFDRATGQSFLTHFLEQGGARDPMDLYIAFRGRRPKVDALLKYSGLIA